MARGGRGRPGLLLPLGLALLLLLTTLLPSLLRGGGRRGISGRVRAAAGGPAPEGTRVTARSGARSETVRTNGRGEFRLSAPPGGDGSYVAEWGPLRAEARATGRPARIALPGTVRVGGRVVDAGTGEAVSGARARCGDVEGVTDERGRFRLEAVPSARGRPPPLVVSAPGFLPRRIDPSPDDPWDDLYLRLEQGRR